MKIRATKQGYKLGKGKVGYTGRDIAISSLETREIYREIGLIK